MSYLFTSESVSEGHPDKIADQISDAILDAIIGQDPKAKVACETLVTTGLVVVAGEVRTDAYVDVPEIARAVIKRIGYTSSDLKFEAESVGILSYLHGQSDDIHQGVKEDGEKEQGAGDQGMMFGYATKETPEFMPLTLMLSHALLQRLAHIRKHEPQLMPYLRPDAKSQVTIEYGEDDQPLRIHTVVISTQHDPGVEQSRIKADIQKHVLPVVLPQAMVDDRMIVHVNPTGNFEIGGPHGDAGLTGRKIIVDTYGGHGAHGGGAFSGKDPSKVDRSAAYAARHIAKNLVAAGVAQRVLVQVSYAIGVAEPVSIYVNTYGTHAPGLSDVTIAQKVQAMKELQLTPAAIRSRLKLDNPIYSPTAAYGHFGRQPYTETVKLNQVQKVVDGDTTTITKTLVEKELEFFTWEKLDCVDQLRAEFGL